MTSDPEGAAMTILNLRTQPVELAERAGDGLLVRLLWDRDRDRSLWVSVLHEETGESFAVDAAPDNALDVFYHPFAYSLPAAA
jgi:hypothetical protein